MPSSLITT